MEWNADNQLKRALLNSSEIARFAYDPLGRRVEKVAGGVTISYTHDGANILREVRGATTLEYIHGPGVDEPLAQEDPAGALTYYHADGLGSVVRRTNQAGVVVHEYRYDAWGNIETGASEPGYSFTGREWDPEIGLYYYRARYYDPRIGRFISEDPTRYRGGLNYYTYVKSRPIDRFDPLGLKEMEIVTCKRGFYNNPGSRAELCCKDQQFAICVEAGQYGTMSFKIRDCLREHEGYHAEGWRKRNNKSGCGECSEGTCENLKEWDIQKGSDEYFRDECAAQLISLRCFMGSGERWPDGRSAEGEAAGIVLTCQLRGWLP
jgi:RHS repeat-associated protein